MLEKEDLCGHDEIRGGKEWKECCVYNVVEGRGKGGGAQIWSSD